MSVSTSTMSVASPVSRAASSQTTSVPPGIHPAPGIKPTTSSSASQTHAMTSNTVPSQLDPSYISTSGFTQFPMQQPTKNVQKQTKTATVPLTKTDHVTLTDTPGGVLGGTTPTLVSQGSTTVSLSPSSSSVDIKTGPVLADSSSTLSAGKGLMSSDTQTVSDKQSNITGAHVPGYKTATLHSSQPPSATLPASTSRSRSQSGLVPSAADSYAPSTGQVLEPITASKTVYSTGAIPPRSPSTLAPTSAPPAVTPSHKPMETEQSTILGGGLSDYILYVGVPACGLILLIILILCIVCICCRKKKNKGSPAKTMMQDLWVNSQPEISLSTRQPLIDAGGGDRMHGQQDLAGSRVEGSTVRRRRKEEPRSSGEDSISWCKPRSVGQHDLVPSPDESCTSYEAVFDFQAESDTHVSLHQGELVTVLRKETNGWWRGTVGDKTGWFPCSYVQAAPQDKLETENEVEMHNDSHLSSFMGIQRPHSIRDSYPTEDEIGAEPIYCKIQPKDKRKSDIPTERVGPKPVEPVILKDNSTTKLPEDTRFIVIYSYEAKANGEISLTEGDLILGKEQDTNGWTNGLNENSKDEGWFPSVYVDKLDSDISEVAAEPGSYKQLEVNTKAGDQPWLGIVHRARHDFRAEKAGDLEFDKNDLVTVLQVLENGWWLGCKDKSVGWFPGSFVELLDQPPSPIDPSPPSVAPPKLGPPEVPESKLTPSPQKKSRLRPARKAPPPPPPKTDTSAPPPSKIPGLAGSKIPKKAEKVSAPMPPVSAPSVKTDDIGPESTLGMSEPALLTSDGLYELIPDAEAKSERLNEKKNVNKPKIPVRYIKPKLVHIPRHEVELPNVSGYNRDSMSCELSPPEEQAKRILDQETPTPDSDSYPPPPVAELKPSANEPNNGTTYHEESETDTPGFFHLPPQNLVSPFRNDSVEEDIESPPYRAFSSFSGSSFGKKDTPPSVKYPVKHTISPVPADKPIQTVSPLSMSPQIVSEPVNREDNVGDDLCDEVFKEIETRKPDVNAYSYTPTEVQKPVSKLPTSPKAKDKPEKPPSRLQPPKHINLSHSNESDKTPSSDLSSSEQLQNKEIPQPVSKIPKGPTPTNSVNSKESKSEKKDESVSSPPSLDVNSEPERSTTANDINSVGDQGNDTVTDDVNGNTDAYEKFVNQDVDRNVFQQTDNIPNVMPKPKVVPKPLIKPKPESVNEQPPVRSPHSVASTPDSILADTPPTTPYRKERLSESENESDKTKEKPKTSKLPLGSKIAQKSPQLRGRKSKIPASPKVRPKNSEHQENLVNMNKTQESEIDTPISTPVISNKQKPASLQLKNVESDIAASENERNLRNRSKSPQERQSGIPSPLRNRSNSPSASKLKKPSSLPGSPATPTGKQSGLVAPKKVSNGLTGRQSPSTGNQKMRVTPSPENVLESDNNPHSDQLSPKPSRPSKPPKVPTQKNKEGKSTKSSSKSLLPLVHKSMEGGSGIPSPGTNSKLPKRSGIPSAKPPRPPPPKSQEEVQEDLSPKKSLFQAVKGYTAQCDSELTFSEGTFIMELSDCDRKGWYMGMLADGTTGLYPRDHFQPSPVSTGHSEA